jgi:hypothetical protein
MADMRDGRKFSIPPYGLTSAPLAESSSTII